MLEVYFLFSSTDLSAGRGLCIAMQYSQNACYTLAGGVEEYIELSPMEIVSLCMGHTT